MNHSFSGLGDLFSYFHFLFLFYFLVPLETHTECSFSQCFFFGNSFVLHLVPRSTDHVKSIQQPAISWTICYFYSRSPVEIFFSIKSSFSWLVTLLVHTGANPGAVTLQPPKPPSAPCPTLAFDQTVNKSFRIGKDFLGAGHTATYLVIAWSPGSTVIPGKERTFPLSSLGVTKISQCVNQLFSSTSEVAKVLAHVFEIRLSSGYHVPQSSKC